MSRIIGQCNTGDFKGIEHLALALKDPEMLDIGTLSRKQKLALLVMAAFKESGIKPTETYKIREILFWDDGYIEFKFLNVPDARELIMKLSQPKIKADLSRGIENVLQRREA